MQRFAYTSQKHSSQGPALALIVLQTDEVLEGEIRRHIPEDVSLFHTRIASYPEVTAKTLATMEDEIPASVCLLPASADIGVVAYGCTSGATIIGEDNVARAVQSVLPGVVVTNPLSAVKAKLRDLGAKRIALLTPYIPQVSQAMIDHLEGDGFEIVNSGSFFEVQDSRVPMISRPSVTDALVEIGSVDCDAIFASCTNLRTIDVVRDVEEKTGVPVVASNSSLAWHMMQLRSDLLLNQSK